MEKIIIEFFSCFEISKELGIFTIPLAMHKGFPFSASSLACSIVTIFFYFILALAKDMSFWFKFLFP